MNSAESFWVVVAMGLFLQVVVHLACARIASDLLPHRRGALSIWRYGLAREGMRRLREYLRPSVALRPVH
jgi:hypothetical protein